MSDGILVGSSSANTIGGVNQLDSQGQISTGALGGNVVSGNGQNGIDVSGNESFPRVPDLGNLVIGNLVGTRADGEVTVANGQDGILLGNSAENTIGGVNVFYPDGSLSTLNGNLISGNELSAWNSTARPTTGNLVIGNRIGTDLTGTTCTSQRRRRGSDHSRCLEQHHRRREPRRLGCQPHLGQRQERHRDHSDGTTGNVVLGNRIGLTADGTATLPNLGDGVLLNAAGNVIGGTVQGAGNVISGNLGSGVRITNSCPLRPPTRTTTRSWAT